MMNKDYYFISTDQLDNMRKLTRLVELGFTNSCSGAGKDGNVIYFTDKGRVMCEGVEYGTVDRTNGRVELILPPQPKNVYINSSPHRGKEVISYLENLGGVNNRSLSGSAKDNIYFINREGFIVGYFKAHCLGILDTFTEIILPPDR